MSDTDTTSELRQQLIGLTPADTRYVDRQVMEEYADRVVALLSAQKQRWIEIIDGLHQVDPITKEVLPQADSEWNEAIDDVIAALDGVIGEQK